MKNGVDMIFGIFNILGYFDRKASGWRNGGYAYKVFVFLGLIFLGAISLGFVAGAYACFSHMRELFEMIVFGFLGIVCAICAIYCVFYFFVETISLIVICSIFIGKQRVFLKNQAEDFKAQKKAEDKASGVEKIEIIQQGERMQFDAKDQYQKEDLHELRPFKKAKRKKFKDQLEETSDQPFLRTKIGFDATILALTCVLMVGMVALTILVCANIK